MVTKRALAPSTIMMGCLFCLAVGLTTAASAPSNNEQTEGVEIKIEADWKQTFTPDARPGNPLTIGSDTGGSIRGPANTRRA